MDYYCAECKSEAKVIDGVAVRSCSHEHSTIIAPRTSVLYGDGGAGEKSLPERAIEAIGKIIKAFR